MHKLWLGDIYESYRDSIRRYFVNGFFKDHATSTSAANKIQKEIGRLRKQNEELLKFDENLHHYADKKISLDLDDGVKVNYGKFGDLLAEVKAVTGKK
jgi:hypothetical protein